MIVYSAATGTPIRPATQSEIDYWNALQTVDPQAFACGYLFCLPRHEFVYLAQPVETAPPAVAVEAKWSDTSAPGYAAAMFTPWP